jgi:hypothetical protein
MIVRFEYVLLLLSFCISSIQFLTNCVFFNIKIYFNSGLLTAYLFIKQYDKIGKLKPSFMFKYFFHRFWRYKKLINFYSILYYISILILNRLAPPMMLVMMVATNLTPYLGNGPNYPQVGYEPTCSKYWWQNLLFIQNLDHLNGV